MYRRNNTTNSECQFDAQIVTENVAEKFVHERFGKVRALIINGEPWFVAKDIANILGYSATEAMTRRLDDEEIRSWCDRSSGQGRDLTIISESGLYESIWGSQKPDAKAFKKWIKTEVLPSIRKHGFYGTDNFIETALADPDNMIKLLKEVKETRRQRDHAIATKAWISRKREATAMNRASQLSKENTRFREQVGDSKTWKQARSIPWLGDFFILNKVAYAQIGRRLTKESQILGIEPQTIEHSKWGTVKTYHSDVIAHFKHKLIEDLNLMRKYRRY